MPPALLLLLLSCRGDPPAVERAPATDPPDIVLLVVDTFRFDHLGLHGYARPTSPALDALAARGTVYRRAYAQSSWTLASFASLLTGRYPHEHRVGRDARNPAAFGRLPGEEVTLPERLKEAGYATGAFVNNTFLAPEFGLQQGFDVYDFRGATNFDHRSAPATVEAALGWLEAQRGPAFLLVHFMEPHMDYAPPATVAGTFAQGPVPADLVTPGLNTFTLMQTGELVPSDPGKERVKAWYDEEILAVDHAIGVLVERIDARPRRDRTTLVVTADHGEEFWEHGHADHGHGLWSVQTQVPLVVAGYGATPGLAVEAVVEHVDLFQGLAGVAGLDRPSETAGEDLFALLDLPGRMAMSENCLYGPPCLSMVSDEHRVVFNQATGVGEAWTLDARGIERERLQGQEQVEVGQRLVHEIQRRRGDLDPVEVIAGPQVPSYETFKQLAALGYLDDGPPPQPPAGE